MQTHTTVLLAGGVDALNIRPGYSYIDATLGAGGHTREMLVRADRTNTILSLDADETAVTGFVNAGLPKTNATVLVEHANFKNIRAILNAHDEIPPLGGILADLGWRMEQFEEGSGKGFSFNHNEPLYMTYGNPEDYPFTAMDIISDWAEEDIANVLYAYGEERAARKLAHAIVSERQNHAIVSTKQLADLVVKTIGHLRTRTRVHPATKTFQALRIAVNDEFTVLETFIDESFDLLAPTGRLAIITFHSLEDRIVKHRFRSLADGGVGTLLTKKPIVPEQTEIKENPRARSAKLRIIEKHG